MYIDNGTLKLKDSEMYKSEEVEQIPVIPMKLETLECTHNDYAFIIPTTL